MAYKTIRLIQHPKRHPGPRFQSPNLLSNLVRMIRSEGEAPPCLKSPKGGEVEYEFVQGGPSPQFQKFKPRWVGTWDHHGKLFDCSVVLGSFCFGDSPYRISESPFYPWKVYPLYCVFFSSQIFWFFNVNFHLVLRQCNHIN